MAQNETVDQLRWSLAQKRMQADARLNEIHEQGALPSIDEVLGSTPVRFVTEHPVLSGVAAGVVYFFGPARLLRVVTTAMGLVQSVRTLRAAQQMIAKP